MSDLTELGSRRKTLLWLHVRTQCYEDRSAFRVFLCKWKMIVDLRTATKDSSLNMHQCEANVYHTTRYRVSVWFTLVWMLSRSSMFEDQLNVRPKINCISNQKNREIRWSSWWNSDRFCTQTQRHYDIVTSFDLPRRWQLHVVLRVKRKIWELSNGYVYFLP